MKHNSEDQSKVEASQVLRRAASELWELLERVACYNDKKHPLARNVNTNSTLQWPAKGVAIRLAADDVQ